MARRVAFWVAAVAVLAAVSSAAACRRPPVARPSAAAPRPPVVLVSIDTLRADHLPAYGSALVETPGIDLLRKDAILFTAAYSPVPLTLPAHVSILTGRLPAEHGVRDNLGYKLDPAKTPTLARLLRDAGYATGGAVSAFVLSARSGLSDSFDFYDSVEAPDKPTEVVSRVQRSGEETLSRALPWVEGVARRPFFLFFHLYEPHTPYEPPEPFKSRYAGHPYDGEIATADAVLGKLISDLKERGIYDRAIVILLSDHGEGLGDHGEDEHGILLYREALHVPLLVKLPASRRAGETVAAPASLIDVLPTVAELLALPAPAGLPGRSLLSLPPKREIVSETFYPRIHLGWSPLRSLFDGTRHFIDAPRPELYAPREDPGEREDRMAAEPGVARSMKRSLDRVPARFDLPGTLAVEDVKKLASLGYLSVSGAAVGERLPNPVDHIGELAHVKEAFRLEAAGQHARAIAAFREILARNPDLYDVRYKLAETLRDTRRYGEAEEEYKRALRASPGFAGPIALEIARLSLARGDWSQAEAHARLALSASPSDAHEALARAALGKNDLDAAVREAALVSGNPAAEVRAAGVVAEVSLRRNDVGAALRVLDAALEKARRARLDPPRNLQFLRGDALARAGRNGEAERAFEEEIARYPDNADAYARLAVLYAVEHRRVRDIYGILERMQRGSPHRETALLASRTLESLGDAPGARAWRVRADRLR